MLWGIVVIQMILVAWLVVRLLDLRAKNKQLRARIAAISAATNERIYPVNPDRFSGRFSVSERLFVGEGF